MMRKPAFTGVLLAAVFWILWAGAGQAGKLDELKAKGEITIGVKEDYPPFGSRNASGELIGLEIDLARDIAERLGVKLKLSPVSAVSRLQFLQADMVDLVIATVSVTKDRAEQADLIEPHYYASTPALLQPSESRMPLPDGLAGKSICTILNAHYNDALESKAMGATLITFRSLPDAVKALADGRCVALAEENTKLIHLKRSQGERWKDYQVVPLNMPVLPWALAIQTGQDESALTAFLSQTVADWQKSGKLIALEKQWLGQNSQWTLKQRDALK